MEGASWAFRAYGWSDVGVRESNQDSAFVSDWAMLLADGVGGGPAGDIASATIIERVAAGVRPPFAPDELRDAVAVANAELAARIRRTPSFDGMATTLSGLVAVPGAARLLHIGDSRVYLMRGGELMQLTRDHSWVQVLHDAGHLRRSEMATHPMRNVVVHSLSGQERDAQELVVTDIPVLDGDRFMISSDGLTDYVTDVEIREVLRGITDLRQAVQALVQAAIAVPSHDNVTVLLGEVSRTWPVTTTEYLGAAGSEQSTVLHRRPR